jgi:antirestriction protein ArdC
MRPSNRKPIYDEITDRVLKALERGVEGWQKPWRSCAPENAIAKRPYRGINVLLLNIAASERGYASHRWISYRAATAAGGHVRRGERATTIVWWERRAISSSGQHTNESDDASAPEPRSAWLTRTHSVFNLDQCEGLDSLREESTHTAESREPIAGCERIVAQSRARICVGGSSASYCPATDTICIPSPKQFTSADAYYATLFHELTHWTGTPNRLNRQLRGRFGDHEYAMEELVAELGAAFVCARFDINHISQAASYIDSWMRVLRSDNRAIFTASRLAAQAAEFLCPAEAEGSMHEDALTR